MACELDLQGGTWAGLAIWRCGDDVELRHRGSPAKMAPAPRGRDTGRIRPTRHLGDIAGTADCPSPASRTGSGVSALNDQEKSHRINRSCSLLVREG